jgi:O-antigen/teichoic acid export membrane protein
VKALAQQIFAVSDARSAPHRTWLARGGTAVIEQGIFAGSNFLLNLTLASTIPPADFGAFTFSFGLFLIAAGFYNALLLEPATVLRPALYEAQCRRYCRTQLTLHWGVTGPLAGLLAAAGVFLMAGDVHAALGRALLGAAVASPFILLLWLARRFLYILGRPAAALAGSAVYVVAIAAGLTWARLADRLSPFAGFMILGCASALGALFLLSQASVLGPVERDSSVTLRGLAVERWQYGRWLIGAVCIEATIVPGLTLIAMTMLGLGAVGALRAMQIFTLPLGHAVTALSALTLPALARDFGHGRLGPLRDKVTVAVTMTGLAAIVVEAGLIAFQRPLEHFVYGGKFAEYAFLIPIVGAASLLESVAVMHRMLLSAVQRPHLYLTSLAITAPCALVTGYVCTRFWGIGGAAVALVVTAVISIVTRRWLARPWLSAEVAPAGS